MARELPSAPHPLRDTKLIEQMRPTPPGPDEFVDQQAEEAVLAMALLAGERIIENVLEAGLREHHFYFERYGRLFTSMQKLVEEGKPVDPITVRAAYERVVGDRQAAKVEVDLLLVHGAYPENSASYAERVVEMHRWREMQRATYVLQDGLMKRDRQVIGKALEVLGDTTRERRLDSLSPEQWGEVLFNYLGKDSEEGFIPLPFPSLTYAMGGGMLPGELMLISGYTNHGKSIIADQMLDQCAKHGLRGHLYMTEMTAAQRGLRLLSRRTGIPFGKLRSRALTPEDWKQIAPELEALPYGVSIVSDWDIEDVVRDALRSRFDLVVIDLIHGFRYEDERDLDRLSKAAQRLARVSTTKMGWDGCAVVIVAHLSGVQMVGAKSVKRPQPGLHSLKGSTSLQQDPDFVLFVWQQDDENGLPSGEGKVYIPKARSGGNEVVKVRLNPRYLRFDVAADV